jgi:hypothetical protein
MTTMHNQKAVRCYAPLLLALYAKTGVYVKKLSSFSLAVSLGLISNVVLASNFGDLPAVLPFFGLSLLVSFFVALAKSLVAIEGSSKRQFRPGRFFGFIALGFVAGFVLIVILWGFTL